MATTKKNGAAGPHGEMDLLMAKDMRVLDRIQRIATDARLRQLFPWDPAKEGLIMVAKITDGPDVGTLHPYDGGTRVRAQQKFGDPDHIFVCWIKEMTEREAAEAFLTFSLETRKPSAYFQFTVALEAGQEWAIAIDDALRVKGVTVAESSSTNRLSAVAACKRIVENRALPSCKAAEVHLEEVLDVTMAAYPSSHEAYDADLLQAVSRLLLDNHAVIDTSRLVQIIAGRSMGLWRSAAQAARGAAAATSGGSESRANTLRLEIKAKYNLRQREPRKLV